MKVSEFARGGPAVVACFLGVAFSVGIMGAGYTLGVFVQPLAADMGWTRAAVQLAPLALSAGLVPSSFLVGWFADRFGARRLILVSQAGFALAYVALGLLTRSIWAFYALYAVMGVVASGTLPVTFVKVLTQLFTRRRGLAIGIALSGAGLCGFLVPVMGSLLIERYGWRMAYVGLAAFPGLIALPACAWLLPRDGAVLGGAAGGSRPSRATSASPSEGMAVREALRTRRYWTQAVAFGLASAAATGVLSSLAALLIDSGYAPGRAARMAGAFGFAVILGRLSVGWLMDLFWGPAVALLVLMPAALATVVLANGSMGSTWTLAAIAALGVATGSELDLAGYLCARYFGKRNFATLYSGQYVLFALGGAAAAALFGRVYDLQGSYAPALYGAGGALALCALLLLSLGAYPVWGDRR